VTGLYRYRVLRIHTVDHENKDAPVRGLEVDLGVSLPAGHGGVEDVLLAATAAARAKAQELTRRSHP